LEKRRCLAKGSLAELFPFVDEVGNSYGFELYQIQETPVKHLFLLNNGNVTGKMDLYKFVGRLLQLGKIGNAELFSGISLSFTVYSGEGTFHITSIKLPNTSSGPFIGCKISSEFGCL
jgi:hypothetical protein